MNVLSLEDVKSQQVLRWKVSKVVDRPNFPIVSQYSLALVVVATLEPETVSILGLDEVKLPLVHSCGQVSDLSGKVSGPRGSVLLGIVLDGRF